MITTKMKNEILKEKGYDLELMLSFFADEENFKKICEFHPYLKEYVYEKPTEEELDKFTDRIYKIIVKE